MVNRPQSTTLGELRASGVRGLLICCGEDCCEYSIRVELTQIGGLTEHDCLISETS